MQTAFSVTILLLFIALLLVPGYLRRKRLAVRRASLTARFGAEVAEMILKRRVWQGQTEEMLLEARGAPAHVEETVLKTKTKRVFKYEPAPGNRFKLRVMVEDGVVVGWEDKRPD